MGNTTTTGERHAFRQSRPFIPDTYDVEIVRAIRDYGFLDSKRLLAILKLRGHDRTVVWMRQRAKLLSENGYVHTAMRAIGNGSNVYSVPYSGRSYLKNAGIGLPYDSNARSDAATIDHFLRMADISDRLHSELKIDYWLTDFQVRSENQTRRELGFAKDYDAVFQADIDDLPLTVAVEYERVRKSKAQYLEISKCYRNDKYVQMVLIVVPDVAWITPMANALHQSARDTRLVHFVFVGDLLYSDLQHCSTRHLSGNTLMQDWLHRRMEDASNHLKEEYEPQFAYRRKWNKQN